MNLIISKDISQIKQVIKNQNSIFILSTKRLSSKELFEKLIKDEDIIQNFAILVENLTWSRGKVLFMAKKFDKKIVIWWYDFYFQLVWNKIKFDTIVIYDASGPMEKTIIKDIKRRSSAKI